MLPGLAAEVRSVSISSCGGWFGGQKIEEYSTIMVINH